MNQYSSRSIQYPIPILVKKSKNTQYINTFLHFESIENTNTNTNTQYFHFVVLHKYCNFFWYSYISLITIQCRLAAEWRSSTKTKNNLPKFESVFSSDLIFPNLNQKFKSLEIQKYWVLKLGK